VPGRGIAVPARNLRNRQAVEVVGRREGQAARAAELLLLDHVHGFDAGDDARRGPESLEAHHRPCPPLDRPVILLDKVIQVLGLPEFDRSAALVDSGAGWQAMQLDRSGESQRQ
jgi:hypothetical protein